MISTFSRICLSAMATVAVVATSNAATVSRDANSLTYKATTDAGEFEVRFCNCMANNLFTFHTVKLNDNVVNCAEHSDNIGPFLLSTHGWVGGNHLSDDGKATARTVNVDVSTDGCALLSGSCNASSVKVAVTNHLLMPDGSIFAIESVTYTIAGNSIEVVTEHNYCINSPLEVDRYYGMQSMFEKENQILIPGTDHLVSWVNVEPNGAENAIKIKLSDAPQFSAFVEKSDNGYQACYMMREDLGNRSYIDTNDIVFVGNSYGKSYHKLIGNAMISPGQTTRWHGVYSWFDKPIVDSFAIQTDEPIFTYPAFIGSHPVSININNRGEASVTPRTDVATAAYTSKCKTNTDQ